MGSIEFKHHTTIGDDDFLTFKEIYLNSFPANELQPFEFVTQRIESGKTKLFLGYHDKTLVCFGLLSYFYNSEFVLLDYMAVESKNKNKKFGTELFGYLSQIVYKEQKNLLIEVEHPSFGDNVEERKRRIRFYLNNGAYILRNASYILPPLDNTRITEMLLMVIPAFENCNFDKSRVVSIVRKMYSELYQRESDDEILNSFIHRMPNRIVLTKNIQHIKKD